MSKTIDARGLSCPQPVLLTLDGIKDGDADGIVVLVDNDASRENVSRAATSKGWAVVGIQEQAGEYRISLRKG